MREVMLPCRVRNPSCRPGAPPNTAGRGARRAGRGERSRGPKAKMSIRMTRSLVKTGSRPAPKVSSRPRRKPPITAPGMLPMPPRIAAVKAFSPTTVPAMREAVIHGVQEGRRSPKSGR